MAGALAGQGHPHGPGGGGEAQAVVEAVADGGEAARGPLVKVTAARQRIPARATARGGVCHWEKGKIQRCQPALGSHSSTAPSWDWWSDGIQTLNPVTVIKTSYSH